MPTIGVSIALPEPWAGQLQHYRTSIGDLTAAKIPTHVTLVPPLEVDDDRLAAVERQLTVAAAAVSSFDMHLRGTGTFRPVSPVVFVSLVEGISQTEQLADACRQGPLALELAFPFHPHVTVAHDLPEETLDRAFDELAGFECSFRVRQFQLFVHEEGPGWRPVTAFDLPVPADAESEGAQQLG